MKYLLTIFVIIQFACKSEQETLPATMVGKWRLVSFDIPSANDAGGKEVKLDPNEAYEVLVITDNNRFEFMTAGGIMAKKDDFGSLKLDLKTKIVEFISEKMAGNNTRYAISKLTMTHLVLQQQTRSGQLGRRYQKMTD
jgi:hypothetical protein